MARNNSMWFGPFYEFFRRSTTICKRAWYLRREYSDRLSDWCTIAGNSWHTVKLATERFIGRQKEMEKSSWEEKRPQMLDDVLDNKHYATLKAQAQERYNWRLN